MIRSAWVLLVLLAASCTSAADRHPVQTSRTPVVDVLVERDGDRWSARYRFSREASGWAFPRSALVSGQGKPWRPYSWVLDTTGLAWERRDGKDVIVAEDGSVPREIRINFRPAPFMLAADYAPALLFTGGSVALFTDHFLATPLDEPSSDGAGGVTTQLNFRDRRGQILHSGRRADSASLSGEAQTYILFGPAEPLMTDHMTAIVDAALPRWFYDELVTFLPRALDLYGTELGASSLKYKPVVMISWGGAERSGASQHGSVLDGLIVMQLLGSGMLKPDPALLQSARWFVAHESAHFWLGQTVNYESPRQAWITEGGADLLAVRAVAAIDPAYDARAVLQQSVDECVQLGANGPVASAGARGEHRAYYACGAVFGMVAEASSGKAFSAWLRPLIESNRADGILSQAEWLAALESSSGDASLSRDVATLVDKGVSDPKAAIASLFTRAGLTHEVVADRVILK